MDYWASGLLALSGGLVTGIQNCGKEPNWEAGASPAESIKTDKLRAGAWGPWLYV